MQGAEADPGQGCHPRGMGAPLESDSHRDGDGEGTRQRSLPQVGGVMRSQHIPLQASLPPSTNIY